MIRAVAAAGTSRRAQQILLALLLTFVLGWGLRAISLDRRYTGSDTFTPDILTLRSSLEHGLFGDWLRGRGPKGPVPALLALPLLEVVGEGVLAARLLSLLAFGVTILLVFVLGRRLWPRSPACLWAALLCSVSPVVFGFGRLDYQEPVLTVFVLGCLLLMVTRPFTRAGDWIALGALCGLGLMVKLSFPLIMAAPGLWLIAGRCRRLRGALHLLLATAAAMLVCSLWLLPNLPHILVNFQQSQSLQIPAAVKTVRYLTLPGAAPLLALALISLLLLLSRNRKGPNGPALQLLGLTIAVSLALFFVVFDSWSRYIVPVLAIAAVTAGCGLAWAQRRLRGRLRPLAGGLGATALLAVFLALNLAGPENYAEGRGKGREHRSGMLKPETRAHSGLPRALAALRPYGNDALWVFDCLWTMHRTEGIDLVWRQRGLDLHVIQPYDFIANYATGREHSVLMVSTYFEKNEATDEAWSILGEPHIALRRDTQRWLVRQRRRVLASFRDPDGVRYTAMRVLSGPTPPGQRAGD